MRGLLPTADPTTGFAVAYREKFGHAPTDYAAPAYDALLLAAYTTARQDAAPLRITCTTRSAKSCTVTGPQGAGMPRSRTRRLLRSPGRRTPAILPVPAARWIMTRSSALIRLITYYSHWIIEDGDFRTIEAIGSAKTGVPSASGESVARTRLQRASCPCPSGSDTYCARSHQERFPGSHCRAIGRMEKLPAPGRCPDRLYPAAGERGSDDHIILMVYDDVPTAPENPLKGISTIFRKEQISVRC